VRCGGPKLARFGRRSVRPSVATRPPSTAGGQRQCAETAGFATMPACSPLRRWNMPDRPPCLRRGTHGFDERLTLPTATGNPSRPEDMRDCARVRETRGTVRSAGTDRHGLRLPAATFLGGHGRIPTPRARRFGATTRSSGANRYPAAHSSRSTTRGAGRTCTTVPTSESSGSVATP
jgi:hypothetical protein